MPMNSTKSRMVETATRLILTKGVEGTAVDDVLKASDTGKSQFYHYFSSKAGMTTQVIEHIRSELAAGRWGKHLLPSLSGWDMVQPWLQAIAKPGEGDHALPLLALTIRESDRAGQPGLKHLYEDLRAPLLAFLQQEQQQGRFVAGVSCEDLADLALTAVIGATLKSSLDLAESRDLVDKSSHHIYLYLKAYSRA